MTKYLFLTPGLEPRQGGVQVSAIDALAGAQQRQMRCIVFGTDPLQACHHPQRSALATNKFALVWKLLHQNWRADIAIFWHMSMLRLLPFLRGFRGKKIVFLHGIEAWRTQTPSMQKHLQSVDLFLSNSNYTWNEFLKYLPEVSQIPHITTALGFGEPAVDQLPSESGNGTSLLIIARMSKAEDYKGHREVISAWPQVLKSIPEARLDIVGEGDLRPDLEQMVAERELTNKVRFHGRVDEKTKADLLRRCTAFAMPSRGEGFGIVYLEAMRYGRPCLVSDCDAGREVVNPPEAGLQVDVRDNQAVATAIIRLLADGEDRQAWSQAARNRYLQNFTVSAYQNRLYQAIDGALA